MTIPTVDLFNPPVPSFLGQTTDVDDMWEFREQILCYR